MHEFFLILFSAMFSCFLLSHFPALDQFFIVYC
nr:MAG TPA: hypothetical protein [Bacteriophage sp.]